MGDGRSPESGLVLRAPLGSGSGIELEQRLGVGVRGRR